MKTAIEKLARLRELQCLITQLPPVVPSAPIPPETLRLLSERDAILASVALPPMDLIGRGNCEEWATAFAVAFPQFDLDTARVWFTHAMACGEYAGVELGLAQGKQYAAGDLVDLLRTLRDVPIIGGRLVTVQGVPVKLADHINNVLNAAGFQA